MQRLCARTAWLPKFKTNGRRRASPEDVERLLQRAVAQPTKPAKINIIAKYEYTDADGALLYQVLRLEPKDFRQRRPDGNGGWTWKLDDRRILYRLPELLIYPDATVFITEGEKDADSIAALNLCATTVAAGKWTEDCIKALTGRDVIILEDNDNAGRKHCAAQRRQSVWCHCLTYGTKATFPSGSLPIRITLKIWKRFALTYLCRRLRGPIPNRIPTPNLNPNRKRQRQTTRRYPSSTLPPGMIGLCRNGNGLLKTAYPLTTSRYSAVRDQSANQSCRCNSVPRWYWDAIGWEHYPNRDRH